MPRALENYRLLVEADELPESERFWLLLALNRSQSIPTWSLKTLNAAGQQALEDSEYPFRETEQLAYLHVQAGNKSTALTLIKKLLQVPEAEREDLLLFASNLAAELGKFRESEDFLTKLRTLRQAKNTGGVSMRGAAARKPSRQ